MAEALTRAGWVLARVAGRSPEAASVVEAARRFGAQAAPTPEAGYGVRTVLVATPDGAIADAAAALAPSLETHALVVHLSGAVGVEAFEALTAQRPDVRLATIHPLQTLAGVPDDSRRLAGSWFAVDGDPDARLLVEAVGGRSFSVVDRSLYHATACVASNHLVALLGQVERLAAAAGVPIEAFGPLVDATVANVRRTSAGAALTGPVARGDAATVARHLEALPRDELPAYRALAREALRLTGADDPGLEAALAEPVPQEAAR